MSLNFVLLLILTLLLWMLVFVLHRLRKRLSLVPLYGLISALIVYTHTLSSFEVSVTWWNMFFLVSSNVYFTPLLLGILIIYLFDGVEAARKALEVVIIVSVMQMVAVFSSAAIDTEHLFIPATLQNFRIYFWSTLAMIADIVAMSLLWEGISKIKRFPLLFKVPIFLFVILMLDAFIFVTGVFAGTDVYWQILTSDLIVRGLLSVVMGLVIALYLAEQKFSERERDKPEKWWSILDIRSALVAKIQNLQQALKETQILQSKLMQSQDDLSEAQQIGKFGSFVWNLSTNKVHWSDEAFRVHGWEPTADNVPPSMEEYYGIMLPEERQGAKESVDRALSSTGENKYVYRVIWPDKSIHFIKVSSRLAVLPDGKTKVLKGSFQDITEEKAAEALLREKIDELERTNKLMIERELKMMELKNEIRQLKGEERELEHE